MLEWWLALFFEFSLNLQIDFAIWITHSLREGLGELARLKMCVYVSRISSLQRWRLGGIYSHFRKTSRFIAVAIPDTSELSTLKAFEN